MIALHPTISIIAEDRPPFRASGFNQVYIVTSRVQTGPQKNLIKLNNLPSQYFATLSLKQVKSIIDLKNWKS